MKACFDFYGVRVCVNGPEEIVKKISMDFSFFCDVHTSSYLDFEIDIFAEEPDFSRIPQGHRVFRLHPDFDFFAYGDINYTKYAANCLTIFNKKSGSLNIYCRDIDITHEITYLAVLSLVGENLERRCIFRIHGLCFMLSGVPIVIISDSGVGKTMLFLQLMRHEGISFYSDEMVLVDCDLKVLPFPLRIGLRQEDSDLFSGIPEKYVYGLNRRKFGPKVLVDSVFFKDKVAVPAHTGIFIVALRHKTGFFRRVSRARLFIALLRNMVLGLGLPQLVEYMNLDFNLSDIFRLSIKAVKRLRVAISISLYSRTYALGASDNPADNLRMLMEAFPKK